MTITDATTSAPTRVDSIIPTRPPKYARGATVVLKGYEDGWRWTVTDARVLLLKKGKPETFWFYRVETIRPYDGKYIWFRWPEWKLRPAPETGGN